MKKTLLLLLGVLIAVVGFQLSVSAQQNNQMEDMQKSMMRSMQEQMMKSMGSGGMGGGARSTSSRVTVSAERARAGEAVFADSGLGTNGKSCKTCHAQAGKKPLDGRKVNSHLIAFVQYCYNNALKGQGIMAESKLNALTDYFTSLQR